jgi:hypothetical protein
MYKPIVRRPKLYSSDQAIIKQTQRIPRHKGDALTPHRLAACLDTLDKRGIGLLVSGFNVGPGHFSVAGYVAGRPFRDVG